MLALFGSHQKNHEYQANFAIVPPWHDVSRAPKSERPKIAAGGSEESWNTFVTCWNNYKRTSGITGVVLTGELFECCSTELGDDIVHENNTLLEGNEENLSAIKRLAVIPVAKSVLRSDVLQMRQDHDEGVQSFYARVKGKADTCAYLVKCTHGCQRSCDYTHEVIKDVLVTGISDPEIRRDVLGWQGLDNKTALEAVTFIESKEMARNALLYSGSTATSAVNSSYRKQQKNSQVNEGKNKKVRKCPTCGKEYRLFKYFKNSNKYNDKPFSTCFDCHPK